MTAVITDNLITFKDWRVGKYYITKNFEVVIFKGSGNGNHSCVGKGNNQEDAEKIIYNRIKEDGFVFSEKRFIDGVMYYDYKLST